ncbi:SIR2 family protein [Legionella cincinnatiensis]|uniref:Uncharacterized protein n=1 Tax=Legionella cincinnatiensis TaxID=28085 RepID=A0A378IKA8_9GAMM|nr:SIR2 family protein [Legionella cincinnatiensis]KTC83336.1 hypothetical protein Lcin_2708 [Legionella cincinnatiensis]STX34921.1 Uncharacterised protein [Legionella cincinnatiensis]
MALDPDYFLLETGLNASWQTFTEKEKRIIALKNDQLPRSEDELEQQHITATACKKLLKYKDVNLKFLSQQGESFPATYQEFIYRTAKHFCEYPEKLPEQFIDRLYKYILSDYPCHIATLNYDKLLYEWLIEKKICSGYYGDLVDGIHNTTGNFCHENLLRITKKFGWYLHLHGSPLFKSENDGIRKENIRLSLPEAFDENGEHSHIVLTNTKYKTDVISGSDLLAVYFDFFINALSESNKIISLGYSGFDDHINFEIKKWITNKIMGNTKINSNPKFTIEIVEWDGSNNNQSFWEDKLFPKFNYQTISVHDHIVINIKRLPNILKYDFRLNN